jgi:GNAT superfamily N-acetyltransferase
MKYKTGRVEYNYKLFTLKENQKVTASCWIFYPNQKYGDNNWLVMRQTFKGDDLTDKNFVMLYYVKATEPGKGYGKLLFDYLVKYLKSKKVKKVFLNVDLDNTKASKFYEKIGFEKKYESKPFNHSQYCLDII